MNTQISIVTYNSEAYIADCLDALVAATDAPDHVVVVDNNSTDGTVAIVTSRFPQVKVIKQKKNLGFAQAHNIVIADAMAQTDIDAVLLLNPDVVLAPDALAHLETFLAAHPTCGSVGGMLYRGKKSQTSSPLTSTPVDSFGIELTKGLHARDRFAGKTLPSHMLSEPQRVFGVSGAAVLYRTSALREVARDNSALDESFFMYKEDVDLAWRLWHSGWEAWVTPLAYGWHDRTLAEPARTSYRSLLKERRARRNRSNYLSFRNHFFVLIKNIPLTLLVRRAIPLSWELFKRFALALLFEQHLLFAYIETYRAIPTLFQERNVIVNSSKQQLAKFQFGWYDKPINQ
jgi:GT2 family glycosyltransferase